MDILLGIRTKNEVLLVTSRALARGISVLRSDDTKVVSLSEHTAMAFSGEPGDTVNFVEFIKANTQLYGFRNDCELSTHAAASFARAELAKSLRSRKPFQVNILIAGAADGRPELHWIDYLGTNVELPYAAHGYASYYVLSTLDRFWHKDISLDDGIALAGKCINELQTRMPIDFKGCDIFVVDADGTRLHEPAAADESAQAPPAAPQAVSA